MKNAKIISSLFLVLIFIVACQKDIDTIVEVPIDTPIITKWNVSITGTVTDKENNALEFATVTVDNQQVQTDVHGRFSITAPVNSEKASIKISKEGYFDNYPVFYPEKNQAHEIKIQLSTRPMLGSVNNGNNVIRLNAHKVDFGTSAFTKADGSSYTGVVNVYMDYLDPTDPDLEEFMPGDLVGVNSDNEEMILKSYGMLNVEMEDENGNPLQIDGEATIKMNIPDNLVGDAPATIPLWYFDEVSGNWIEEGTAVLDGNEYVGSVTHFTLWNCDAPFPIVTIHGIVNTNVDPRSMVIRVSRDDGDQATTIPNQRGYFEGKVPKEGAMLLEILSPCGGVVETLSLNNLGTDTDLGEITIDLESSTTTISGTAVDCDLNPVIKGYVLVESESTSRQYIDIENGVFSAELLMCSSDPLTIVVFDTHNLKESGEIDFPFGTELETGEIGTCDSDIPLRGLYLSGPEINHFIPAVSKMTLDSVYLYEISLIDNFGNGDKRIYNMLILNWTGDPDDPELFIDTETIEIGNPGLKYVPILETEGSVFIDNESGGLFDIEYTGTIRTIDSQLNETDYPNHTIQLIGLIE